MAFNEQSKLQLGSAPQGAQAADLRERLAQYAHQIEQLRHGLPHDLDDALGRIEHGLAHLTDLLASAEPAAAAATREPAPDLEDPWDVQSAEALMRVYEAAGADLVPGTPRPAWSASSSSPPADAGAADRSGVDRAWLDGRLSDMATMLRHAVADPGRPLIALEQRLDQFEQRLDATLTDLAASAADNERLDRIEARVGELASHLEATCRQLERLERMDGQLGDLLQSMRDRDAVQEAGAAPLSETEIAALIDSAAERAASRLAQVLPATDVPGPGAAHAPAAALEELLQGYVAERRCNDERSGSRLQSIEGILGRLADRVDSIDDGRRGPDQTDAADAQSADNDRIAQAYAAGARALGLEPAGPPLDASDYDPPHVRAGAGAPARLAPPPPAEPPPFPDAQSRQELRASAMRAKAKASLGTDPPPGAARPSGPGAEPAAEDRPLASRLGSYRPSLLLVLGLAFLSAAGILLLDGLISRARLPKFAAASVAPLASLPRLTAPHGSAAGAEARAARPETAPAAAPVPPPPGEADRPATAGAVVPGDQPGPTLRFEPLRTGSTGPRAEAPVSPAPSADPRTAVASLPPLPPELGPPELRKAAADGDPAAQFEIAIRYAEGKEVAQSHALAFAWYERAAHRGLASAQFRLAAYLEHGVGVAADPVQALAWYRKAATQGYVRAMHNLAVLSVGKDGAQADYATAAQWFRKAAERGLADSQFNLAVLHEHGRGVAKDAQAAYTWYALAARSGDQAAARQRDRLRAKLDPARLRHVDQTLATWRPLPSDPRADR